MWWLVHSLYVFTVFYSSIQWTHKTLCTVFTSNSGLHTLKYYIFLCTIHILLETYLIQLIPFTYTFQVFVTFAKTVHNMPVSRKILGKGWKQKGRWYLTVRMREDRIPPTSACMDCWHCEICWSQWLINRIIFANLLFKHNFLKCFTTNT